MELSAEVEEELEALRAIYSEELVLEEHRPHTTETREHEGQGSIDLIFRVQGRRTTAWACLLKVSLRIPQYPLCCPPIVTVTPQDGIIRSEVCGCLVGLEQRLETLQGAPAVHEVLSWVHDRLDEVKDEPAPSPPTPHEGTQQQQAQAREEQARGWVALVLIDHMNRPRDYTALLQDWARELQLQGVVALLCASRHVYVLLHGPEQQRLQEWLKRLRTHKVDVDSKGRPCRERMSSVLLMHEAPAQLELEDKEGQGLVIQEGRWQHPQHFLRYAKDHWRLPL